MLSKDHFSNKLNGVAGRVASTILQYVAPRVLYAWQNPGVPVDEVMKDIMRVFHHPALRDESLEVHRNMFNTVKKWVDEQPDRNSLNHVLNSASVKAGRNHAGGEGSRDLHEHGSLGGHGKTSGSIWTEIKSRDLGAMEGGDFSPSASYLAASPQPGSPGFSPQSPQFGYQNHGISNNNSRPGSQGGHLNPNPHFGGGYQSGPPPNSYQQPNADYGQEPPSYGMPPGPPDNFGGAQYGGYQQGPPPPGPWQPQGQPGFQGGYQQGGYQQGPPPGPPGPWQPQGQPGYPGGPQPPYPNQYPPQYPPYQQPPYGGGGGYGGGY